MSGYPGFLGHCVKCGTVLHLPNHLNRCPVCAREFDNSVPVPRTVGEEERIELEYSRTYYKNRPGEHRVSAAERRGWHPLYTLGGWG